MIRVQHDPGECRQALARTSSPIVLDLETTGLKRTDRIVSAGLLVDGVAHILFVRSMHASIPNIPRDQFLDALRPLEERPDLVVIGHNVPFDLGFLRREGIVVQGEARDTEKLLRLIDQDRGRGKGGPAEKHKPRIDLRAPGGPGLMNYKLKPVVAQLLGLRAPSFPGENGPGGMELVPYTRHATYLACDLTSTKALYDYLWLRLTEGERAYYQQMVAPLIPILLDMMDVGVAVDREFIEAESKRLGDLMTTLSEEHKRRHGLGLGKKNGMDRRRMDRRRMGDWLFGTLRLPTKGGRGPSLNNKVLEDLQSKADSRAANSLQLIRDFRKAASLSDRLGSLIDHIDRQTGRIYSSFDDRQATGRISSTNPNLQQLAKYKKIAGQEFRSRNVVRASDGYEFAVFDISQADIRVLAHAVESFQRPASALLRDLRRQRRNMLGQAIAPFMDEMRRLTNPDFVGEPNQEPGFDPSMPADLAEDFRQPPSPEGEPADFYTIATSRIIGRPPIGGKKGPERKLYKEVILSVVNGMGAETLAEKLKCSEQEAKTFLRDFDRAYPKVSAFKQLMYRQIALTGQTFTFMGRPRTATAHRWLVTEPQVEILVSYRRADAYWLDVVPLRPSFRVLTTFVRRAWNARVTPNRLIYDSERGRLSSQAYSLFADQLQYRLPIRNWSWRNIRRVRVRGEEAEYEGFDATARAAFNFICQAGTADICKLMMFRSMPVCREFGARLLIQIHDELVFEVPQERTMEFLVTIKKVLEEPPIPGFAVPIVVEAKRGRAFGDLVEVKDL